MSPLAGIGPANGVSPSNAILVPSGDQDGRPYERSPVVMRVKLPPLTGTVNTERPAPLVMTPSEMPSPPTPSTKAILVPSGDHVGCAAPAPQLLRLPRVTVRWPVPSALITRISRTDMVARPQ